MHEPTTRRDLLRIGAGLASLAGLAGSRNAKAEGATDPAQALLASADATRYPPGSFSVSVSLAEYRGGQLVDQAGLTVFSKPAPDTGQYNNLVRYTQPQRDAGKLLLRNGLDLWFYDPTSQASVRISPQARLIGQASNGDVMSTNLSKDYRAVQTATEDVEDANREVRHCARLRLTAERPDVAYVLVDYWIDMASRRPVKASFLTAEGRVMKTGFFRRYQDILGAQRPTETVIIDGLTPTWLTVMRLDNFVQREIPQSWLQRDYLPHFSGNAA